MRLRIHLTTLTILMFCDLSCQEFDNPSNDNDSKSSTSSEESKASNGLAIADDFLANVPDDFQGHFIVEQVGVRRKFKVLFQPGETRCMKALKWLEERYRNNTSVIKGLVRHNVDSCPSAITDKKCGMNGLGHVRSFINKCHQCAIGCRDVVEGGTRYVSRNQDECKRADQECKTMSCLNGATCAYSLSERRFRCHCPNGYRGTYCEEDIDECASSPCQNGATCVDKVNKYECNCTTGFRGTNCDVDIDECANSPCQNGATCVDKVNGYMCNCVAGFQGTNCDVEIDECESSPCQNGATCVDYENGYECNCTTGFQGTNCDFETAVMVMEAQRIVHCVRPLPDATVPGVQSCSMCHYLEPYELNYQSNTLPDLPKFNCTNST